MKLIDGEWLAAELFKHHVHDEDELEPMVYLSDAQNLIATAPKVDAIPVEWILNLKNEYAREGREQAEGDLMNLLLMWQKEQEART